MDDFATIFRGRRILITGHTGFKGSWLSEWLLELGSEVWGFSLPPPTVPSLFDQLQLAPRLHHTVGDIRDLDALKAVVSDSRPDFVFHLAAQSLVRTSYKEPVETFATNVMGTINVLQALRGIKSPCAAIMVTTDKCYENRETKRPYREDDPLGGHDPYSSSKGAAEIVISAYRRSFFTVESLLNGGVPPVAVASARAGNVIGGGDWAKDRIVPDCVRCLSADKPIGIRNPHATRPWQHVLQPLSGYLSLAAEMWLGLTRSQNASGDRLPAVCGAFNFGPSPESNQTVGALVAEVLKNWPGEWEDQSDPEAPHEAGLLSLSIAKAEQLLGWAPVLSFESSISQTIDWYREARACQDSKALQIMTRQQIKNYSALRSSINSTNSMG